MNTTRLSRPLRILAAMAGVLATTVALTGCNAVDSFTGSQSMRWTGSELLPKKPVRATNYKAVALLPDLTAKQAAKAFGHAHPSSRSSEQEGPQVVSGDGWAVSVEQSPFATSLRYTDTCGPLLHDPEAATEQASAVFAALGVDIDAWEWFTFKDATGASRVVAEPDVEGTQTWATALIAVLVDEDGVCGANAHLMGFEKTGSTSVLPSAYEVFQKARHTEGLDIAGDYDSYTQTWTLKSEGLLVPLWQFSAKDHAIVAVDLGDGLETALDTRSSLTNSVPSPTSGQ